MPYNLRAWHYLDDRIGVSAQFDNLKARFSFRARVLDYFWAGLPVLATRCEVLGDLVERKLGGTAAPEDVDAWVAEIERLLDDTTEQDAIRRRLAEARYAWTWPRVVEPLRAILAGMARLAGDPPPDLMLRYIGARLEHGYRQHAAREARERLTRHLLGRQKPLSDCARPGYGSPL